MEAWKSFLRDVVREAYGDDVSRQDILDEVGLAYDEMEDNDPLLEEEEDEEE